MLAFGKDKYDLSSVEGLLRFVCFELSVKEGRINRFAASFLQETDALHSRTRAVQHEWRVLNNLPESSSKLNIKYIWFAGLKSEKVVKNKQLWICGYIQRSWPPLRCFHARVILCAYVQAVCWFPWFLCRNVHWHVSTADLWSESSWQLRPRASTVTLVSPTTALPSWACWGWPTRWPSREVNTTSTATRLLRWLGHASRRLWCPQVSGEIKQHT